MIDLFRDRRWATQKRNLVAFTLILIRQKGKRVDSSQKESREENSSPLWAARTGTSSPDKSHHERRSTSTRSRLTSSNSTTSLLIVRFLDQDVYASTTSSCTDIHFELCSVFITSNLGESKYCSKNTRKMPFHIHRGINRIVSSLHTNSHRRNHQYLCYHGHFQPRLTMSFHATIRK